MVQAVIKQWRGAYRPTGLTRLDASLRGIGLPRGGITSVISTDELSGMIVIARAISAAHRRGESCVLILPQGAWLPETAKRSIPFSDATVLWAKHNALIPLVEEFVQRYFDIVGVVIPQTESIRTSEWGLKHLIRKVFSNRTSLLMLLDADAVKNEKSTSGLFYDWSSAVIKTQILTSQEYTSLMMQYQKRGIYPIKVQSEEPLFLA